MRITYALLALLLAASSALLGLFFLGSAGLAASATEMTVAWWTWASGVSVVVIGLAFAIRAGSMGALLGLCCVPFALAIGIANLTLRFGH